MSIIAENARALPGRLCAVVKADAYGLGALRVAEALAGRAEFFAVATADEALELSARGFDVLLLNFPDHDLGELVRRGVRFAICAPWQERAVEAFPEARVHVKFDGGMNRLGYKRPEDALAAVVRLNAEGLYTHFFSADEMLFAGQKRAFQELCARAKELCPGIVCHVGGSGIARSAHGFDLARAGIDLYRGAARLKAQVLDVKDVAAGEYLSYGERRSERNRRVAVVSCGYADGVPRGLSDNWQVRIRGRACPVVGKVCMDLLLADVSEGGAAPGDEVTVIEDFAAAAERLATIDYEIMTGVSSRAKRVYK